MDSSFHWLKCFCPSSMTISLVIFLFTVSLERFLSLEAPLVIEAMYWNFSLVSFFFSTTILYLGSNNNFDNFLRGLFTLEWVLLFWWIFPTSISFTVVLGQSFNQSINCTLHMDAIVHVIVVTYIEIKNTWTWLSEKTLWLDKDS